MNLGQSIRYLLGMFALGIIVWSFYDVGRRVIARAAQQSNFDTTLTILHWGDPRENRIVQNLVDRYQAENPRTRIIRVHASDFDSKLKTMMAAGTPPDLFYLPPRMLPELASLKLIRPIDDLVAAENKTAGTAWFDDFFPVLLDAYRFDVDKQQVGAGQLYGLPKDFTTAVFYANVGLWKKAGLETQLRHYQDHGWTWNEFADAMRKIRALDGTPEFAGREIYGGLLDLWPDTLRQVLWTFGGEFFETRPDGSADFTRLALGSAESIRALEFIANGRLNEKFLFNATGIAKDGGQEFLNGSIGVHGPVGRWRVPTLSTKPDLQWDILPVPYDRPEHASSQLFTTAWTMSSTTANPAEAFKVMKFLTGGEGARAQSRAGLAIPPLKSVANSPDFLSPEPPDESTPRIPPHRSDLFLEALKVGRVQQIPRLAEWERIVGDKISRSIQTGQVTATENVREIAALWQNELTSPLRVRQWPQVAWGLVLGLLGTVVAVLATFLFWRARKEKLGPIDAATERAGYAFIAPWIVGFAIFTFGPMLMSLLLSLTKWSAIVPVGQAEFVGATNYTLLFTQDPAFWQSLRVTAYFVLLAVPVGQIAALLVALLMNQKLAGITLFRTIYFVPSVVSGAALAVLWLQIYNNDYGIMNTVLRWVLDPIGLSPPNWFGVNTETKTNDAAIWAVPAFVIMGLWGVGAGMIIYLAGLKGIPQSLYEAATVDGAGTWRKFTSVTLPMLSPLIFYNLVMGIIGSFQVFTQAYIMTGAGPDNATLFYVYQLYRQAFEFHNMGYASAMAWILFVICLLLTVLVFRGSRGLVHYEGLKN
jgi:multiple sugar transport system permease protein